METVFGNPTALSSSNVIVSTTAKSPQSIVCIATASSFTACCCFFRASSRRCISRRCTLSRSDGVAVLVLVQQRLLDLLIEVHHLAVLFHQRQEETVQNVRRLQKVELWVLALVLLDAL